MKELYFVITFIVSIYFIIKILLKFLQRKSFKKDFAILLASVFLYIFLWTISFMNRANKTTALGEDICFDDWCATITSFTKSNSIGNQKANGQFISLSVRMTNKARGIAQKPSEPRINLIDGNGNTWGFSKIGQKSFENLHGKQIPIDQRLELHESLQTNIVFDIPKDAEEVEAIIKEGPQLITNILIQEDKKTFKLW